MTSPARAYYVEGVQLVNCGGEMCASCDIRPAVGRSISALPICQRCAAWAESEAAGLAYEMEDARARREAKHAAALERVRRMDARIADQITPAQIRRSERRSVQVSASNVRRADALTHFKCGHERTAANTYKNPGGRRFCRQCRQAYLAASKRARRERGAA